MPSDDVRRSFSCRYNSIAILIAMSLPRVASAARLLASAVRPAHTRGTNFAGVRPVKIWRDAPQ
jgi:hypothetical protein